MQLSVNPSRLGKRRKCFPKMYKISLKSKPASTHVSLQVYLKYWLYNLKRFSLRQALASDVWLHCNSSGLVKSQAHSQGVCSPRGVTWITGEKIPMSPMQLLETGHPHWPRNNFPGWQQVSTGRRKPEGTTRSSHFAETLTKNCNLFWQCLLQEKIIRTGCF